MSVRKFNKTGDYLRFSPGAATAAFGSWAGLIGPIEGQSVEGTTCVLGGHNATEGKGLLLWVTGGKLAFYNGTTSIASGITVGAGEGDLFLGWTKATGTQKVRFYKYRFNTTTWTIEEPAGTAADAGSIAAGGIRVNEWQNTEFTTMNFYGGGTWGEVLSEANMKSLVTATSITAWKKVGTEKAGWILNQGLVAEEVTDLTGGGANQAARNLTEVVAGTPPIPFVDPVAAVGLGMLV